MKHVYAVSKNDGSIATKEMIDELLRVTRYGRRKSSAIGID